MNRAVRTAVALVAVLFGTVVSRGQEILRPVTSAYMVEAGTSRLADTYLTPLHYSGWHGGLGYSRMQAMRFCPGKWVMELDIRLNLDRAQNPARNASMWNLEVEGSWAMMRRWHLLDAPGKLTAGIGPNTQLRGGAFLLARNGNNPASAKGAWTVGGTAFASYGMKVGRLPVTLRYEVSVPVTGVFFAPQYGELYYEIWMGNRSGLVHGAWWGNYFNMDNLVTADLHFGATTLRLGYHNEVLSTKVNDVVTRGVTHSFCIGVVTEWLSLPVGSRLSDDVKIISAMY